MSDQDYTNEDLGETGTDRFDAGLARVARDLYQPPPGTPRDEMWAVIRAARAASAAGRGSTSGDGSSVLPLRRFRPRPWWAAVAAALVIGVVLGRGSLDGGPDAVTTRAASDTPTALEDADRGRALDEGVSVPRSYRVAAARHLNRTEDFLTMFRVDARTDQLADLDLSPWAKKLLTDTRLLLDSPAGGDPELRMLLSDLELVLAQIVQLRAGDSNDVDIIDEGLESSQLLFRLKAAQAAAPPTVGL